MRKNAKVLTGLLLFALVLLVLCLFGCKKDSSTKGSKKKVGKPQNKPAIVQKQVSSAKLAPSTEKIDFRLKKDPFQVHVSAAKGPYVPKRNRFGQIIPILNYELKDFKVKGIIVGLNENSALILDPTRKPYVVKVGMEIGRYEGIITKITPHYIEVVETYRDEAGKEKKSVTKLMLPKKE